MQLSNFVGIGLLVVSMILVVAWGYWWIRQPEVDYGRMPFEDAREFAFLHFEAGRAPWDLCREQAAAGYWNAEPDLCGQWWAEWNQADAPAHMLLHPRGHSRPF